MNGRLDMANSEEPTDWQWERDKEKAQIQKTVVMSDDDKEAAYRRIDEKYADLIAGEKERTRLKDIGVTGAAHQQELKVRNRMRLNDKGRNGTCGI